MKNYLDIIENTPLFAQINKNDLAAMLDCLDAAQREYAKNSAIFMAGDTATRIGIVLEGRVQIVRDDLFGNHTILTNLAQGDMFGETFACAGVKTLPVSIFAMTHCIVLLLNYSKVIETCSNSCVFHNRMIENMLRILAEKNLGLNQKIEVISARTTREKLMAYLTAQAGTAGSRAFDIPYNRQELADYLSVDRSAMSAELSRMQRDGILKYHKSRFELLSSAY